jgi:hypothetical protein
MSDIPAAAVEAAVRVLFDQGWSIGDPDRPDENDDDIRAALAAAAPLIRQATADEIAAALDDEAERASGPIFTRALEHAAEIARRVGGGGGGGQ